MKCQKRLAILLTMLLKQSFNNFLYISMFFDKIQNILLAKRKRNEFGYSAVGDLLRNVHGTEARIIDVIFNPGGSIIKFTYDDELFYYTTLRKLQEKYFKMVEYSSGRMSNEEYGDDDGKITVS